MVGVGAGVIFTAVESFGCSKESDIDWEDSKSGLDDILEKYASMTGL